MKSLHTDQRGFSTWAVVAVLAALALGFFVLLGIGGVVWYLTSHRPSPAPPVPGPATPAPQAPAPVPPAAPPPGPQPPAGPAPQPPAAQPQQPGSQPPAAPAPQAPVAGGGSVHFELYMDPAGEFCVRYPSGWQVLPDRLGVGFSPPREDPSEGTAARFTRLLMGPPGRVAPAREDLEAFAASVRQRYPDFRVELLDVRPLPQDSEAALLQASWTNARREAMRGLLVGLYLHSRAVPNAPFSLKQWKIFQAQQVAWASLDPVFQRMSRSFTPIRQNPPEGQPQDPGCR